MQELQVCKCNWTMSHGHMAHGASTKLRFGYFRAPVVSWTHLPTLAVTGNRVCVDKFHRLSRGRRRNRGVSGRCPYEVRTAPIHRGSWVWSRVGLKGEK